MKLETIFQQQSPIIGMIHFLPLVGYGNFTKEEILQAAFEDLRALERGGVDAIMVENNYDIPHRVFVEPETITLMAYLSQEIRLRTSLPLGISVLWNDYKAALSIAKVCDASFVRVPVFVDTVETSYGKVVGKPKDIVTYRKNIGAEHIAPFTDIHVKHARLISSESLEVSAQKACDAGSNAIIITGKWTGDAPNVEDLQRVRHAVGNFPILIGSGADEKNIKNLLFYADGAIVSTSLKNGSKKPHEVNTKSYAQRVSVQKTKFFMRQVKEKRLIKG